MPQAQAASQVIHFLSSQVASHQNGGSSRLESTSSSLMSISLDLGKSDFM